jgi:hypothetical protein
VVAPQRLPPFPDELLAPARKADAIRLLTWLGLPFRIGAAHLKRWGEVAGVEITTSDLELLPGFPREESR